MTDVAVLSVISSGVVGILGGATGFYGQRVALRTEESKRVEARQQDLRTILSEAAAVAMGCNPSVGQRNRNMRELGEIMDSVASEMELHRARLGVRVGPRSPVFIAYRELGLAILNLEEALWEAPDGLTVDGIRNPEGLAPQEGESALAIATAYQAIYVALGAFFEASVNLVGAPT